jgi:predicted glycogen debranching enzyme
VARHILTTFARFVDQGMLPNVFPDSGEKPEYNTADAALWYFEAVRAYHAATQDAGLVKALFPVLADMIGWHVKGTRYGIGVDAPTGSCGRVSPACRSRGWTRWSATGS